MFFKSKIKSGFCCTQRSTSEGVASWRIPLPQLAPKHTVQGCIGESMATCINLTDLGFDSILLRQKARTSATQSTTTI